MSTNPPSFRLPFTLPEEDQDAKIHPQVAAAIRYLFNGVLDVNQAIPVLNDKITASTTTAATAAATGTTIGATNNQAGQASYAVQQTDYGALVVVSHASSVAVSLNSAVKKPYYTRIKVDSGSGAATLTPTTGTVNNAGFVVVPAGTTVDAFYNSSDNNWTVA